MAKKDKINADFMRLETALKTHPLPHVNGTSHLGEAQEFMWMNESTDGVHFKHSNSRNYLTLKPDGSIHIPTGRLFERGTFDRFGEETKIEKP